MIELHRVSKIYAVGPVKVPALSDVSFRIAKGEFVTLCGPSGSGKIAKDVFGRMLASGEDAGTIVKREGLTQVADAGALEALVDQAIAGNAKAVADFKAGKTAAAKALVGQVMKASGGKANPGMVDRLVQEKLSKL